MTNVGLAQSNKALLSMHAFIIRREVDEKRVDSVPIRLMISEEKKEQFQQVTKFAVKKYKSPYKGENELKQNTSSKLQLQQK